MNTKQIRRLTEYETAVALDLAWRVFSEYNSSPYGLGFYKKLRFVPTEEEKTINGIRFTPMIYERKSNGSDL